MNPPAAQEEFAEYRRTRDRALRNRIIERHAPLAAQLARRFAARGQPAEDLRQVALLGLLKAVERFEPERGLAFTTFATPTVLGELKRHFRDTTWAVRVPRQVQENVLTVSGAVAALAQELRRSPTVGEVAQSTGISEERVLEAMEANRAYRADSIDLPPGGGGDEGGATGAPATRLGRREPGFAHVEHQQVLAQLLAELPERERTIVELRFWHSLTQAQIAERLGISQMHVSRLLARTIEELRGRLGASESV